MSDDGATIVEAIQNQNAITLTDGSYKSNSGKVAYIIERPEAWIPLYGENKSQGTLRIRVCYVASFQGVMGW